MNIKHIRADFPKENMNIKYSDYWSKKNISMFSSEPCL